PQAERMYQGEPGEPEADPPEHLPGLLDQVDAGFRVRVRVLVAAVGGMLEPLGEGDLEGQADVGAARNALGGGDELKPPLEVPAGGPSCRLARSRPEEQRRQ